MLNYVKENLDLKKYIFAFIKYFDREKEIYIYFIQYMYLFF